MKALTIKLLIIQFVILVQSGFSQGFLNLNFEAANPTGYSPGAGNLPTILGLPSWTAYYSTSTSTNQADAIWYDNVSGGGAFIALTDTNSNELSPLQGAYSLLLEGSGASTPTAASIGQTAQIPTNALSLSFFLSLNSTLQLTFNSQAIPLFQTGSTPNYVIMDGDISAFSGQTGELRFTALPNVGYGLLDNIQFSTTPIPEPTAFSLFALGGLLIGCRRWRKFKS